MSRQPLRGPGERRRRPRPVMALTSVVVSGLPLVALLALSALSTDPPPPVALLRLLTMFTVQSNAALALVAWCVWRERGLRHPFFSAAWNAAVVGAMLTGVVAAAWMRPDLSDGVSAFEVANLLLHVVGPLMGLALWLSAAHVDPNAGTAGLGRWIPALGWPALWAAWVLILGALSSWYPYRQLDPADSAALPYWQSLPGIAALVVTATTLAMIIDRVLRRPDPPEPAPRREPADRRPVTTHVGAR